MYLYCKVVHFSFGQLEEKIQVNILIPFDTKHHQSFPDRGRVALIPKIILDFFFDKLFANFCNERKRQGREDLACQPWAPKA